MKQFNCFYCSSKFSTFFPFLFNYNISTIKTLSVAILFIAIYCNTLFTSMQRRCNIN